MTPREAEILRNMLGAPGVHGDGWLRPMDFGGYSGSEHGKVAARMAPKGWVATKYTGGRPNWSRKTWFYQLTEKGQRALANHEEQQRMNDIVIRQTEAKR